MAKTKTLYLSDDNKEFETEEAANAHNAFLKAQGSIEKYITYAGLQKAQAGLLRTHIAGYLAHVEAGQPERTAEELEAMKQAREAAEKKGKKDDKPAGGEASGGEA